MLFIVWCVCVRVCVYLCVGLISHLFIRNHCHSLQLPYLLRHSHHKFHLFVAVSRICRAKRLAQITHAHNEYVKYVAFSVINIVAIWAKVRGDTLTIAICHDDGTLKTSKMNYEFIRVSYGIGYIRTWITHTFPHKRSAIIFTRIMRNGSKDEFRGQSHTQNACRLLHEHWRMETAFCVALSLSCWPISILWIVEWDSFGL